MDIHELSFKGDVTADRRERSDGKQPTERHEQEQDDVNAPGRLHAEPIGGSA